MAFAHGTVGIQRLGFAVRNHRRLNARSLCASLGWIGDGYGPLAGWLSLFAQVTLGFVVRRTEIERGIHMLHCHQQMARWGGGVARVAREPCFVVMNEETELSEIL